MFLYLNINPDSITVLHVFFIPDIYPPNQKQFSPMCDVDEC